MRRWVVPLFSLILVVSAGCAPAMGVMAISRAGLAIEAATLAGSDELAPYEYTAAKLYHDKAREKQNRSQFGVARTYAQKADFFAQKAREKAEASSGDPVSSGAGAGGRGGSPGGGVG